MDGIGRNELVGTGSAAEALWSLVSHRLNTDLAKIRVQAFDDRICCRTYLPCLPADHRPDDSEYQQCQATEECWQVPGDERLLGRLAGSVSRAAHRSPVIGIWHQDRAV
jgi:hypothetical protein